MDAIERYKVFGCQLKKGQSITFICRVAGNPVPIDTISTFSDDCVCIRGKSGEGEPVITYATVEQLSFSIQILNTPAKNPPKEIGFKAIEKMWDAMEKTEAAKIGSVPDPNR